jgi:hypothetical protein
MQFYKELHYLKCIMSLSEPPTPFHKQEPPSFSEMLKENYYDEMYHNQEKYGSLMREQINSMMNDEWYEDNKQQMEKTCPELLAYVDAFRSGAKRYPAGLQREYNRADEAAKVKTKCEEQLKIATANLASLNAEFKQASQAANTDAAADIYKRARDRFHQILESPSLPCFDEPKFVRGFEDGFVDDKLQTMFDKMQQTMKDIAVAQVSRYETELDEKLQKYDNEKTVNNYNSVVEVVPKLQKLLSLKTFLTQDKLLDKLQIDGFVNKYKSKLHTMVDEHDEQPTLRAGGKKRSKSKKSSRKTKSNKSSRKTKSNKSRKTKSRKTKSRKTKSRRH